MDQCLFVYLGLCSLFLSKNLRGLHFHGGVLEPGLTQGELQDLKDFARQSGLDVVYSEVGRERDGRG